MRIELVEGRDWIVDGDGLRPTFVDVNGAFDATSPDRWVLHFYNSIHLEDGMMTEVS